MGYSLERSIITYDDVNDFDNISSYIKNYPKNNIKLQYDILAFNRSQIYIGRNLSLNSKLFKYKRKSKEIYKSTH